MFNRWKPYPKNKPKEKGWYQCSIRYGEDKNQAYVMDLYYYPESDKWKDNRRQDVFNTYAVYGYNDKTHMQDKLLLTERVCCREDVIAFKRLPKIYR